MTNFEETLLRKVATLPESRQADVLAFVRYWSPPLITRHFVIRVSY
jgi:hypothetical protein